MPPSSTKVIIVIKLEMKKHRQRLNIINLLCQEQDKGNDLSSSKDPLYLFLDMRI